MRLAFITQDFAPKVGGIETYSLELSKRFQDLCEFYCVIAPQKEGAAEVDKKLPFHVKRIFSSEPLLGWFSFLNLPAYIRSKRIDTVFHAQWTTLPVSVFLKKAGIIDSIFVASHARELLFNPFKSNGFASDLYVKYRKALLKYVDVFFPVSEYTAGLLQEEGISGHKIEVVINGTDPDSFYPMNTEKCKQELGLKDKKVLLTITRLVSRKGVDTVLKALPQLTKIYPDLIYMIVGEGQDREALEQLVQHLGLDDFVEFTGRVPYENLIKYYNACDVFVMPSKTEAPDVEGFGIVFLEANACKKPVVGSRSGGIPSAVLDEQTGLLVEEQNPEELATAIKRLFDEPELASRLGENGRDRILKEANWDAVSERIFSKIKAQEVSE